MISRTLRGAGRQAEERSCVCAGGCGNGVNGGVVNGSEGRRSLGDEGGFIAFSPPPLRRKVWTVGLNQGSIERHAGSHGTHGRGLFEGQHAAKGQQEPQVEEGLGVFRAAGKAMGHSAETCLRVPAQDFKTLAEGFATMDNQGQIRLDGKLNVEGKRACLVLTRGFVVMEVEAGLADGHHALPCHELPQTRARRAVEQRGIMRMEANGGEEVSRMGMGQGKGLLAGVKISSDGDNPPYPGLPRTLQHGLEIRGETRVIQVRM